MFENTTSMQDIFSTRNIIIYFVVINIVGFLIMFMDKQKAKKGAWRIPEKTIFIMELLQECILLDIKHKNCNL